MGTTRRSVKISSQQAKQTKTQTKYDGLSSLILVKKQELLPKYSIIPSKNCIFYEQYYRETPNNQASTNQMQIRKMRDMSNNLPSM